jgi:hypothetical protein
LEAAASSICCLWHIPSNPYSGIFWNVAGREVGLDLFIGLVDEGCIGGF